MQYTFQGATNAAELTSDCVVVGVYQDGSLSAAATQLDSASQGKLREFIDLGDFSGKKSELYLHYALPGTSVQRVLLTGLGPKDKLNAETIAKATQAAAQHLKAKNIRHATSFLSEECTDTDQAATARQSVQAVAHALYSYDGLKSNKGTDNRSGKLGSRAYNG